MDEVELQKMMIQQFDPYYFYRIAHAVDTADDPEIKISVGDDSRIFDGGNWKKTQLRFLRYQATEAFFSWLPVGPKFSYLYVKDKLKSGLDRFLNCIQCGTIFEPFQSANDKDHSEWITGLFFSGVSMPNFFNVDQIGAIKARAEFLSDRSAYNSMKHGMSAGSAVGSPVWNLLGGGFSMENTGHFLWLGSTKSSNILGAESVDLEQERDEILHLCMLLSAKKNILCGAKNFSIPKGLERVPTSERIVFNFGR